MLICILCGCASNQATKPRTGPGADVRDIQRMLKSRGLIVTTAADESITGPASLMLLDPDGDPILIDQHVPSPRK